MTYNPNKTFLLLIAVSIVLLGLTIYSASINYSDMDVDLFSRRLSPSLQHWFGTNNLGQDLWSLCFKGMLTSLQIGLMSAIVSGFIALFVATLSSINRTFSYLMRGLIDMMLSLPHLLLLILVCFTLGGGKMGVIWAIALTHWPKLALILRTEIFKIQQTDYIMLAKRIGNGYWYRWYHHFLPAIIPQWIVGTLLMFPHAILHCAALSFLGFGLSSHETSLGLLLADALRYLNTGAWWLALFPGLVLVSLILLFDQFAHAIQKLWLRIG